MHSHEPQREEIQIQSLAMYALQVEFRFIGRRAICYRTIADSIHFSFILTYLYGYACEI